MLMNAAVETSLPTSGDRWAPAAMLLMPVRLGRLELPNRVVMAPMTAIARQMPAASPRH